MRNLASNELQSVSGGVSPRIVAVNPGGQSNKSTEKNPNTTFVKMTGKPA